MGSSSYIQSKFRRTLFSYFIFPFRAKRFLIDNVYDELEKNYIATSTNAGNYLIGIGIGMIYVYIKKKNIDLSHNAVFRAAWYSVPLIGLAILQFCSWVFLNHTFEKPSIWISLVSVFTRNFWGLLAIIFLIGSMFKFKCKYCIWIPFVKWDTVTCVLKRLEHPRNRIDYLWDTIDHPPRP